MRTHLSVILIALGMSGLTGGVMKAETLFEAGQKTSPPPLLVLEEDEPLLLDEPDINGADSAALQAQHDTSINARCYVCHVNYKQDPFVQWHLNKNIGCVKCHGESPEHIADEANLTPPEIMYWPSRVGFSCYWCHPRHDVPVREVIARWLERGLDQTNPNRVLCTQCHGAHRLNLRTIIWNKRTGALISKTRPTPVQSLPRKAAPLNSSVTNSPTASLLDLSPNDQIQ
jgi:hypothetical protein